jgi:hypothetical protein
VLVALGMDRASQPVQHILHHYSQPSDPNHPADCATLQPTSLLLVGTHCNSVADHLRSLLDKRLRCAHAMQSCKLVDTISGSVPWLLQIKAVTATAITHFQRDATSLPCTCIHGVQCKQVIQVQRRTCVMFVEEHATWGIRCPASVAARPGPFSTAGSSISFTYRCLNSSSHCGACAHTTIFLLLPHPSAWDR